MTDRVAEAEPAGWLRENVHVFLKPLVVALLRDRPADPLAFSLFWLQTAGKRALGGAAPEPRDTAHLPHSDAEEEEACEEAPRAPGRKKLAISAEAYGEYHAPATVARTEPKSDEQRAMLRARLQACTLFAALEPAALERLADAMAPREFAAGERVLAQGDDGDELFLVCAGRLRCERAAPGAPPVHLRDFLPGDVFGELALLYNTPRAASVQAVERALCFALDRATFNGVARAAAEESRRRLDAFLARVEILRELRPAERGRLCDCLQREVFARGELVLREGEPGDKFYLVQEGRAEAFKCGADGAELRVFEYAGNDYFGELALLGDEARQASIRVVSDELVVASLSRETFKRLLGPLQDILQRNAERYALPVSA